LEKKKKRNWEKRGGSQKDNTKEYEGEGSRGKTAKSTEDERIPPDKSLKGNGGGGKKNKNLREMKTRG